MDDFFDDYVGDFELDDQDDNDIGGGLDDDDDELDDDYDFDNESVGSTPPYAEDEVMMQQNEVGEGVLDNIGVGVGGVYLNTDEFRDEDATDVMAADKTGTMAALRATGTTCQLGDAAAECGATTTRTVRFSSARPNRSGRRAPPARFITGPDRRTQPIMTKFEFAAIIGERATLIERDVDNVDPYVAKRCAELGIDHALDIAEIELRWTQAPFPMKVHRRVAHNVFEVWQVRELKTPDDVAYESYDDESTRVLQGDAHTRVDPFEAKLKEIRSITRFAF